MPLSQRRNLSSDQPRSSTNASYCGHAAARHAIEILGPPPNL